MQGHHQLHLVMEIVCQQGIRPGNSLIRRTFKEGVGRLDEEEGRLAAGVTHLLGMVGVISAHAVHPAHRKALRGI